MSDSELIKLAGLWQSESKAGTVYLSGGLGMARLYVLPNGYKKHDGSDDSVPDFYLCIKPREVQQDASSNGSTKRRNAGLFG